MKIRTMLLYGSILSGVSLYASDDEVTPGSGQLLTEKLATFHKAAACGDEGTIYKMKDSVREFIHMPNENGDTALHLAIAGGHESTMKALLTIKANVQLSDKIKKGRCLELWLEAWEKDQLCKREYIDYVGKEAELRRVAIHLNKWQAKAKDEATTNYLNELQVEIFAAEKDASEREKKS